MPEPSSRPRIVNIINFIRAVEPREPVDMLEPVVQQVRLARRHELPTTFLLQYDALLESRFTDLLRSGLDAGSEVGAWLEIVQPQVEAAGLTWRGRFPWDWHADVGFSIGYTPPQRERLIDVLMERFRAVFGRYPASVGSWFMDAHSLAYLADRYGITASCWCKDQIGTDGYTVWGGYWNQAYYPSRRNAYMPAQTAEAQIPVPVFRMLGSDPIEQYGTNLVTLEPSWSCGADPHWVQWFFDVLTQGPCVTFGYAQVGQENSFGWPKMGQGLAHQYELLARLRAAGQVRVETLADSARWFRERFALTPASAFSALKDWRDEGRRSAWYESRFYRVNLLWEGGALRVRDAHRFDERYAERHLVEPVRTHHCTYDALPVVDGFRWSGEAVQAGLRPVAVGGSTAAPLAGAGEPQVHEQGETDLSVQWPVEGGGALRILCRPERLAFALPGRAASSWALDLAWDPGKPAAVRQVEERAVRFEHEGFAYAVTLAAGRCRQLEPARIRFEPDEAGLAFEMDHR